MTYQILKGLELLEKLKIAHRDIKPDNIILVNGKLKLNDFGCAKTLSKTNNPYVVSQYY
jgi:glycogen synthase kinase 3 beta